MTEKKPTEVWAFPNGIMPEEIEKIKKALSNRILGKDVFLLPKEKKHNLSEEKKTS